jgi:hypothetical protein
MHEGYIHSIKRINKSCDFDYIYNFKSSSSGADFLNKINFHNKYNQPNETYEKKEKCKNQLLTSLMAIQETLNILDEKLYSQVYKEAKKTMKVSDEYKSYFSGYTIFDKPQFNEVLKIKQIVNNKPFSYFKDLNLEDQIFKLDVKINHFYYYTNNTKEIYFVTASNDVICVKSKKLIGLYKEENNNGLTISECFETDYIENNQIHCVFNTSEVLDES